MPTEAGTLELLSTPFPLFMSLEANYIRQSIIRLVPNTLSYHVMELGGLGTLIRAWL
jgi:hypothetical protein